MKEIRVTIFFHNFNLLIINYHKLLFIYNFKLKNKLKIKFVDVENEDD